jgi:hypothetical protein
MDKDKTAHPGDKIRVSRETNSALKAAAEKSGNFSASQLADAILREACAAIAGKGSPELPTVAYLRLISGAHSAPTEADALTSRMTAIEEKIGEIAQRLHARDEVMQLNEGPPARRAKH